MSKQGTWDRPQITVDKIYYGWVNPKSVSQERSALFDIYSRDNDLRRQAEIADKADQRFRKCRQGIGKAHIRKAKSLMASMVEHPQFRGWSCQSQKDLLQQFADFKPKATFFEGRDGRKLPNHERVMHAIGKLKNIRNRAIHTEQVKQRIAHKAGQRMENMFEMDPGQLRQMVKDRRADKTINKNPFRSKFFVETVSTGKSKADPARIQSKTVFDSSDRDREWQMVAFADDNNDLVTRQKKVWDSKRMKYVGVTLDSAGQNLDHKRHQQREYIRKTTKLKRKFGAWKRTNKIQIRPDGDFEDKTFTSQMRNRFSDRKRQKFRTVNKSSGAPSGGGKKFGSKGGHQSRGRPNPRGTGGKKKNKLNKIRKRF